MSFSLYCITSVLIFTIVCPHALHVGDRCCSPYPVLHPSSFPVAYVLTHYMLLIDVVLLILTCNRPHFTHRMSSRTSFWSLIDATGACVLTIASMRTHAPIASIRRTCKHKDTRMYAWGRIMLLIHVHDAGARDRCMCPHAVPACVLMHISRASNACVLMHV